MAPQQNALFLPTKLGEYTLGERHIPTAGKGQLLVKNETTALNPIDWKIQKHGWFIETYPALLGTDIAGVVVEVGEGVTGFAKGDRVFFQGAWTHDEAGYQQYTLTNAATTAKIPAKYSFDEIASIPVTLAAAVVGFYMPKPHGAGLKEPFDAAGRGAYAGKPIFIAGGATSVGQFALQLAKLSGFSPIITTASLKHEAYLQTLGATHVIDRNTPTTALAGKIAEITNKPLEVVFDSVSSAETQKFSHDLTAAGGTTVFVLPGQIDAVAGKEFVSALGIFGFPHTRPLGERLYAHLTQLVEEGHIRPNRVEVLSGGLGAVRAGLDRLENDLVSGTKLVIHPQETA